MSPDDVKKWLDLLVVLIGSGGVGTIILAFVGYWKAKAERPPHIAPPQPSGMAQIAGMVLGRQDVSDFQAAMTSIATSMAENSLAIRAHMGCAKEIADTRHRDLKTMNDHLDTLNDRLKDLRVG